MTPTGHCMKSLHVLVVTTLNCFLQMVNTGGTFGSPQCILRGGQIGAIENFTERNDVSESIVCTNILASWSLK